MADKFYAATNIKYGARKEDDSAEGKYESTTFKAGDEVTGLPKEEMVSLWNKGALTKTAPEKPEEDEEALDDKPSSDNKPAPTKATPAKATGASVNKP
jgi:hypothetical protein